TSLSSHHLHLSERWNEYFPLLEGRLNSYMPIAFQAIRLFLFAGIIFSLLDAWQVMSFQEWLTHGQGLVVLQTLLRIVLVLRSEEHTSELQSRFALVCRHLCDKR